MASVETQLTVLRPYKLRKESPNFCVTEVSNELRPNSKVLEITCKYNYVLFWDTKGNTGYNS